ncbi:hypothetical protein AA0Z99_00400 [Agrococcus sp. 1P02AA]|uniref:hypothetical protein n=1 Tax=Agrococcus sp. 1P02AA TaxID=3132259 RepID=UPI0039A6AEEB
MTATVTRPLAVALVGGLVAIGLTACAPSASFSVLDREASAGDAVPAELGGDDFGDADPDSARFVGEHGDAQLWLMRGGESPVCLLVYVDAADWGHACGAAPVGLDIGIGWFEVVADGQAAPEGSVQISENVYARG